MYLSDQGRLPSKAESHRIGCKADFILHILWLRASPARGRKSTSWAERLGSPLQEHFVLNAFSLVQIDREGSCFSTK